MGYSVGRWEEETLVVESAGFNNRGWLDGEGHPHTEALRITWRLRRPDFGHLEIVRTLVDPGALVEPWTVPMKLVLHPDSEPLEYVCNENEKDLVHMVGKASDEKEVRLAPELLAKYAGTYQLKSPTRQMVDAIVRVNGEHLELNAGMLRGRLRAISDKQFSFLPGIVQFVSNDAGDVTHMLIQLADGADLKAERRR